MNRFLKTLVLSSAVAATTLTAMPTAFAQDWRYRDGYRDGYRHHHNDRGRWHDRGRHHRRDSGRDAAIAGIAGLAVGALAGAVISQSQSGDRIVSNRYDTPRTVYQPAPRYAPAPQVVYRGSIEPWSREWYRYCENRYRSFNPSDGTFTGYDGIRRFCEAN